jgi:hypothetical protein
MKIIEKGKFWKKAFVDHSYKVNSSILCLLMDDKYNADLYFLDISFQINKKIQDEITTPTIN